MRHFVLPLTLCILRAASKPIPQDGRNMTCRPLMKGIVFNEWSFDPAWFDLIPAAGSWVDFNIDIAANITPLCSPRTIADHVPMMAFQSMVAEAVALVNGPNPPEWLLTFNEPDLSYGGVTPTMTPQQAATAIEPLLQSPGNGTKFVAPVPAEALGTWLEQFFTACDCEGFFSAYNVHSYFPTTQQAFDYITAFHNNHPAKPMWVTEIAPGNANPLCSLQMDYVSSYMEQVYSWANAQPWIDRVFWNTGNQDTDDTNVCNSYLLDFSNQPTPLLDTYTKLSCS